MMTTINLLTALFLIARVYFLFLRNLSPSSRAAKIYGIALHVAFDLEIGVAYCLSERHRVSPESPMNFSAFRDRGARAKLSVSMEFKYQFMHNLII